MTEDNSILAAFRNDPNAIVVSGRKVRPLADPEKIKEFQESLDRVATNQGGRVVGPKPTKKKTKKKITRNETPSLEQEIFAQQFETPIIDEPSYVEAEEEEEQPKVLKAKKKKVEFKNGFGKMRVLVESILESEVALGLIFSSEDDIVFEPSVGESIHCTIDYMEKLVYYPGVLFTLPDGVKKLMILFIKDHDNE